MSIRPTALAILIAIVWCGSALAAARAIAPDCGGLNDPDSFVFVDPAALAVADLDRAIAACTRIIQGLGTPRERAVASINRAVVHFAKSRLDRSELGASERAAAAEDFNDAVSLDPKFAFAYYARGEFKMWALGEDPAPDYAAAIRLDPDDALAFQGRAMDFERRGEPERAIADYSAAIRLDPTLGRSFAGRGVARHEIGDDDAAIPDLTEALRLTADDPTYRLGAAAARGMAFFGRGNLDSAVADFSEVVRIKPSFAYAYLYRGVAQFLRGAPQAARADLQHATELGPKNADFAAWREIVDRRSHAEGRLAEAEKTLDMIDWPAIVVQALLGEPTTQTLLEAANDGSETMRLLKTCEAYVFTGELALLKAAKAEATDAFKTAVATCPAKYFERSVAAAELRILSAKP